MAEINIISWNIQGIRKRSMELYILARTYQPDIICLQETFLKPGVQTPYLPGYTHFRQDRETKARGGGLLTYVMTKHQASRTKMDLGRIETLAIKSLNLTIVNTYLRTKDVRKTDCGKLAAITTSTVITGDLNVQNTAWGDRKTTRQGEYLEHYVNKYDLKMHRPLEITHPAQQRNQHDAVLDCSITTADIENTRIRTLNSDNTTSDHFPIMTTIEEINKENHLVYRPKTDWLGVQKDLDRAWPWTEDQDYNVEHFTSACQVAMLKNTSYIKMTNRNHFLLPEPIRKLQKEKRDELRKHRRSWTKKSKKKMNKELRRLNMLINRRITEIEQEKIVEELTDMNDPDKRWARIKKRRPGPPPIPTLEVDGRTAHTNLEKSEALAEALAKKFVAADTEQDPQLKRDIENIYSQIRKAKATNLPTITEENFEAALKQMRTKSAAGPDGISPRLLKILPEEAKQHLRRIFNQVIQTQKYPAIWKKARVTMLPKPGKDPKDPASYRPISLLSCVGKLFERCILPFLNVEKVPDHQFGFRQNHGTTQQLTRLIMDLTIAQNLQRDSVMVALDVEAAFDKVPHKELIFKLTDTDQPMWMLKILMSYYEDRTFTVRVQDEVSSQFDIKAGTAQGAVLSPPLYSLYMHDIPVEEKVNTYQYADDTLFMTNESSLHGSLDIMTNQLAVVHEWCQQWRTKINASKSEAMIVQPKFKRQKNYVPPVIMNNTVIPYRDKIKYLGIMVDKKLTFDEHCKYLRGKAWGKTSQLAKYLKSRKHITSATKITLYKTIIETQLSYGLPAWNRVKKQHFEMLRRIERAWIRNILFLPKWTQIEILYENCESINLRVLASDIRDKFVEKNEHHPNMLIQKLFAPLPDGPNLYPTDILTPGY